MQKNLLAYFVELPPIEVAGDALILIKSKVEVDRSKATERLYADPFSRFVTITVDKQLIEGYYAMNPALQYDRIRTIIVKYLNRYKMGYYFVPEMTKIGNIHLHGIINADDHLTKQFTSYVRRRIGRYSKICDTIIHPKECYNYCHKDGLYLNPLYAPFESFNIEELMEIE